MKLNTEKSKNIEKPIQLQELVESPAKTIWVVEVDADKRLGQWGFLIHNKKNDDSPEDVKIKCLSPDGEPVEYSIEEYGKKILAYRRPPFFFNN